MYCLCSITFFMVFVQLLACGFDLNKELKNMQYEVKLRTQLVTNLIGNRNTNAFNEVRQISIILKDYIHSFQTTHESGLLRFTNMIIDARKNITDPDSSKGLCLLLQLTKAEPLRQMSYTRASYAHMLVEERVEDLLLVTSTLLNTSSLTNDIKTIVELCVQLYPGVDEDVKRHECLETQGPNLKLDDKIKGDIYLDRLSTVQHHTLLVTNKTDVELRRFYLLNEYDLVSWNETRNACEKLQDLQV